MLKRAAMTILGVAVMLGFWTVKGWFTDEASASLSHIPQKVWDGGGGTVVFEVESSDPARVSISFETNDAVNSEDHKFLESWEKVGTGAHTFSIEVPSSVGGTAEISAENPKIGSRVRIAVKVDGRIVAEDFNTLTEPLQPGYGFFAQVHLEDYASGKLEEDD
ncbi:MAG: hypothetical protein L0Z52_10750 [Acidobacteria bacterium]|nr:hypothetical protein [Acidobacteriota bacterium]